MQIKKIKIGNCVVGDNEPSFIIAEIGANFKVSDNLNENYKMALHMIDCAVTAKADAVKFQLYSADKLYNKNAGCADYIGKKREIYDIIQDMELPRTWIPKLKKYCDDKNIIFLCTPFDEDAVDVLESVDMVAYKIASYTISHIPFLKKIAKLGKPIILSTGASDDVDIKKALDVIYSTGNKDVILLQCTAKYPAPFNSLNLRSIPYLREKYNVNVGLSDHSRDHLIGPLGAVSLGACVIEKHYTTDNNLPGPDHGFAILDSELIDMVAKIRNLEQALGLNEKSILDDEKELRSFARRFIYASQDISKGEIFSEDNLSILRSGKAQMGLEPEYYDIVLGKKCNSTIKKNDPVKKEDVDGL
ncbi:N-acetylneuraminate synthase family protein [Candidatus Woesearchaeota archaeon]|nr:N-acetylneuraminate synthase family protein [Candidatus Woesearchaeota archaeon]